MDIGLCDILPARPTSAASYPVSVRRVATLLHASFRRSLAVPPLLADQVAINYRKADITERQKAMLDLALKVSRSAETVGEADFDVLKSHGFDEEDIWDIAGDRRLLRTVEPHGERDRHAPQL